MNSIDIKQQQNKFGPSVGFLFLSQTPSDEVLERSEDSTKLNENFANDLNKSVILLQGNVFTPIFEKMLSLLQLGRETVNSLKVS